MTTSDITGLVLLWLLGRTVLTQLASYQLLIAKSHLYFTKGKTGSIPKKGIPITNGYLLGLWLTWREFQQSRAYKAELRRVTKDVVKSEV